MSFQSVKEIKNTSDTRMVNALIAAGWELLAITPGTDSEGFPFPQYTLGWKKEGEPVKVKQDW